MKIFVNIITTIRFTYALFLPILKNKISEVAFVINIAILFLTDSIDGILARKHKVQTLYGSIMDTIADKTLSIILLLMLTERYKILSIILLSEIIIAITNIIGKITGRKVESSIYGKIKMWLLSITIVIGYMSLFSIINKNILLICVGITSMFELIVIIDYIYTLVKQKEVVKHKYAIKNLSDLKYVLFDTDYYMQQI